MKTPRSVSISERIIQQAGLLALPKELFQNKRWKNILRQRLPDLQTEMKIDAGERGGGLPSGLLSLRRK
jgi:hypothetical protein